MADRAQPLSAPTLMHDMGLTEQEIERRKRFVGLGPDDLGRIAALKDVVVPRVDDYTAVFFQHLAGFEEARGLTASRELSDTARRLKAEHLRAMVEGEYGPAYVDQRLKLGLLYSKAGLDPRVFMGAFHQLLLALGLDVMKRSERAPVESFTDFMALKKIAFFDISLIVDVMAFERERVIRQQQEAIRELSTPVLQIRERLLLLPIIGVIDTLRARLITESLLRAIRANRARVVVMDVTGVATIDSRVANHLLQTVSAARLMGANVIVTGLSSEVAQSLVALGIDLTRFNTIGDLQGGLEEAERLLGYRLARAEGAGPAPA